MRRCSGSARPRRPTLVEAVHGPVLAELARRGAPFVGLLYAGLMLTADGVRVLEFNCRFGDPETQAVLPLLEADLLELLAAAARGDVAGVDVVPSGGAAVTVVLAAERYPADGDRGGEITGVEEAEAGRRARLPRGNGAAGGAAGDERWPDPGRDRARADGRGRARRCVRRGGADRVSRAAAIARDIAATAAAAAAIDS